MQGYSKDIPLFGSTAVRQKKTLLPAEAGIADEVSPFGLRPPNILGVVLPLNAAQPFSQTEGHNQNQPGAQDSRSNVSKSHLPRLVHSGNAIAWEKCLPQAVELGQLDRQITLYPLKLLASPFPPSPICIEFLGKYHSHWA